MGSEMCIRDSLKVELVEGLGPTIDGLDVVETTAIDVHEFEVLLLSLIHI